MRISKACCLLLSMTFLAVAVVGCGDSGPTSSNEPSDAPATKTGDEMDAEVTAALAELSEEDRLAAEAQKYCAVMTESRLGSMGAPVKVMIDGQSVFLCCEGCKEAALDDPQVTLANIKRLTEASGSRN